jgi:tRNA nucleotidyltransferase (CCA-adding enzyme)
MGPRREIDLDGLGARITALPGFDAVRAATARTGVAAHLVGGAVRDALLGSGRADLDLVVEGDHLALARALGGELRSHERFATATVRRSGLEIDVARTRAESYPHPGALPEVRPAGLAEDLARRDFSVNAIAVAVAQPGTPIDPEGGIADLAAGVLRALHDRSLADDPTRALRAARYVARLGLEVEPSTLEQIRAADLRTVSADRVDAELARLAREPDPRQGFELLDRWGLVALGAATGELIDAVGRLLAVPPWAGVAEPPEVILAALEPATLASARELRERATPDSPSAAVAVARGRPVAELALARALGAEWLDPVVGQWRAVELEIGGDDLLAAGVPEGEAVGRGLAAALRAKLDGQVSTRAEELAAALDAARRG